MNCPPPPLTSRPSASVPHPLLRKDIRYFSSFQALSAGEPHGALSPAMTHNVSTCSNIGPHRPPQGWRPAVHLPQTVSHAHSSFHYDHVSVCEPGLSGGSRASPDGPEGCRSGGFSPSTVCRLPAFVLALQQRRREACPGHTRHSQPRTPRGGAEAEGGDSPCGTAGRAVRDPTGSSFSFVLQPHYYSSHGM